MTRLIGVTLLILVLNAQPSRAEPPTNVQGDGTDPRSGFRRVLLIGQGPDGHPFSTHEYMAGVRLLEHLLQPIDGLQPLVVRADGPWTRGPELIDGAHAVVLFVSEGARWIRQDHKRLQAFQRLSARQGGFVCLHWGMGTRQAENIADYVKLFGGCHGGPDRRYKVVQTRAHIATNHPVTQGLADFDVNDEFYYALKFAKSPRITPLLNVTIEGAPHTVAWAWQRADGGRSFGFSGCHFHRNWSLPEYRRLVVQGVLWSANFATPKGFSTNVPQSALRLEPRTDKP